LGCAAEFQLWRVKVVDVQEGCLATMNPTQNEYQEVTAEL